MLFSESRQILYILAYSHVYGRDRLIQVTGTKHKTVLRRILENLLDRHDSINITGSLLHQPEIKGGIRILFDQLTGYTSHAAIIRSGYRRPISIFLIGGLQIAASRPGRFLHMATLIDRRGDCQTILPCRALQ